MNNQHYVRLSKEAVSAENKCAAFLSIILPGLGHIYKGHKALGLLLMFAGTPLAVLGALLLATGTAGFGVLVLPVYWLAVMVHVYAIQDRVGPDSGDEGEEY